MQQIDIWIFIITVPINKSSFDSVIFGVYKLTPHLHRLRPRRRSFFVTVCELSSVGIVVSPLMVKEKERGRQQA